MENNITKKNDAKKETLYKKIEDEKIEYRFYCLPKFNLFLHVFRKAIIQNIFIKTPDHKISLTIFSSPF